MSAKKQKILTLESAIRMQRDLYNAFNDDDFRNQLDDLECQVGKACDNYTEAHSHLFLSVQTPVLTKYGFSEGKRGMLDMLKDVARFNGDDQFQRNRKMLNEMLGLTRTSEEEQAKLNKFREEQKRERRQHLGFATPLSTTGPKSPPMITENLQWHPVSVFGGR